MLLKKPVAIFKKNYPHGRFIFWSDLASSHYAQLTLQWIKSQKIPIIPKSMSPTNSPEIRPIELFWVNLKAKVYSGGWETNDEKKLIKRIKKCAKSFPKKYFITLFKNFRNKIINANKNGLNSLIK